jgi:hypothetical protein
MYSGQKKIFRNRCESKQLLLCLQRGIFHQAKKTALWIIQVDDQAEFGFLNSERVNLSCHAVN